MVKKQRGKAHGNDLIFNCLNVSDIIEKELHGNVSTFHKKLFKALLKISVLFIAVEFYWMYRLLQFIKNTK